MSTPERWLLDLDGHSHVVEIADAGLRRRLSWTVDGTEVANLVTSDERVVLTSDEGVVGVRLPTFVGPARRVTLHDNEIAAHAGPGGTDFDAEAGSAAARREAWIREHPRLHTARQTAVAAAGVLIPILAIWLLSQLVLPRIPWPDIDLPSIPWPDIDLPSIPWPDITLPSIPWPGLPDLPDLPAWVRDAATFVGPVLLAFFLARGEVKRRRDQDRRKHEEEEPATTDPTP